MAALKIIVLHPMTLADTLRNSNSFNTKYNQCKETLRNTLTKNFRNATPNTYITMYFGKNGNKGDMQISGFNSIIETQKCLTEFGFRYTECINGYGVRYLRISL